MKLVDFLGKILGTTKIGSGETVVIEFPTDLYYKELAIYTAKSYIANAISMCEIRVFHNYEPVKDEDYYRLNIAPNKNENASHFWHKVINKMTSDPEGALVLEIRGELHLAESFSIKEERPVLGNIYDGVVLEGGLQLRKSFRSENVYLFKMEDDSVKHLIDGVYAEYGKLMQTAARAFRDTNGRKFKLKISGLKQGDEEFAENFKEFIADDIKKYMENEYATYVEYEGETLQEESGNKQAKSSDDIIKLREDMFEIVGQAFKIPSSLMSGNVTSLQDVCDVFLTFAVDPFADTISKVLNKRATQYEFAKGNYYKCYTGGIKHRDLFDTAEDADKLIASSIMCTDEVREELELMPLNTNWSRQHYITNNYSRVEDMLKKPEGGEEENE